MRNSLPRWTDGVVLFDKPTGISSQKAVTIVKHACHADKAGHTGTLDPLATGLLAVCLGEATKYSQDLFNADKTYIATMIFGVKTDTGDAEGKTIEQVTSSQKAFDPQNFAARLEQLTPQFMGNILQVPPMYSAIKRDGKPLYAYAREGEMFDLEPRHVRINHLTWLSVVWPVAVLEVSCSKGTYIRSLINDLGDALGCGAHMTALRRTQIGHINIALAQEELAIKTAPEILPVDALITHLPELIFNHDLAIRCKMGQRLLFKDVLTDAEIRNWQQFDQPIKIYYSHKSSEQFMGLVELRDGVLHPKRLMATDRLENLLAQGGNTCQTSDTLELQNMTNPIH